MQLDKQQQLEKVVGDSKAKAKELRDKLKEVPKDKNAKDAADFVKNFINKPIPYHRRAKDKILLTSVKTDTREE